MTDCKHCIGLGAHVVWTEMDDEGQREPSHDRPCHACGGSGMACSVCDHLVDVDCPFCEEGRAKEAEMQMEEQRALTAEAEEARIFFEKNAPTS